MKLIEYGSSGLSSLKEMSQKLAYSNSYNLSIVNEYQVEVCRLDDEINMILGAFGVEPPFEFILKIDTQGFEYEVLKGADECIRNGLVKYVIIELMTLQKYENTLLYNDIMETLHSSGFKLWDINPHHYESDTKRMSEFDAIFILDKIGKQQLVKTNAKN